MGTAMSIMLLALRTIATAKETSATLGPQRELPRSAQREPSTAVNPPGRPATLACSQHFRAPVAMTCRKTCG